MSVWPLPRITFQELNSVQETRPVALLTTAEAWAALNSRLTLPVAIQAEPSRYDAELFDYLAANLPSRVKAIYAIGNGAPVEAGKVIASRTKIPLIIVPTALDSAQPFLPTALVDETVEDRKRRVAVETGPAAEIILDWDLIQAAPEAERGACIVDVMSIITGLLDWRLAAQKGKNPREQRFLPWAASVATDLAKEAIKNSGAIGQGQPDGLRTLLNLTMLVVQLSSQLGHTRAQQGSEHYLAQMMGVVSDQKVSHAEIVAPCLLFAAALHGQDPAPLRDALEHAGVRLDQMHATDFNLLIDDLDGHLADYEFPYSILNELDPRSETVAKALEAAGLTILPDTWMKMDETQPASAAPQTPVEAPSDEAAPASSVPEGAAAESTPAATTPPVTDGAVQPEKQPAPKPAAKPEGVSPTAPQASTTDPTHG